ncbi:MAG: L,D-transpeptidase [Desulfobaccales bacterium]|jgi:L,D-transpeptidase ErfK/SrfK
MARRCWLLLMILLARSAWAWAGQAPPLYHQMVGGEEHCRVPGKTTLGLLAAEKGVKWTVLARRNGLKIPYKITPGMVLKINTAHIVPAELDCGLVINLPELLMYHFANGAYQRCYSLAVGKPTWQTPTGTYQIVEKRTNPIWQVPVSIQEEMEEEGLEVKEKVPPGPKNPLGNYYMGTSAWGIGIHATNRPWSVGYYVSHGCMRMLPQEMAKLFPQIEVGTPVKIIYRPIKLAVTSEGRVFLEAHPDIYQKQEPALDYLRDLAEHYQLGDRLDWDKVPAILKAKEGIAREITKGRPRPLPLQSPPAKRGSPQEVRLSPLQLPKSRVD